MATFLNLSTLGFFLYYAVPGFVAIKVRDLIIPSERRNWTDSAVAVISFSMLNLAVCFLFKPVLNIPGIISSLSLDYFPTILVVFVVPAAIGAISAFIWRSEWLQRLTRGQILDPTPTAWEYVFGIKKETYWMIFHLKSGQRVGALYSFQSFTSSFPNPQEIYVEQLWKLDKEGCFIEKIERTAGAIIKFEECYLIELFTTRKDTDHGRKSVPSADKPIAGSIESSTAEDKSS